MRNLLLILLTALSFVAEGQIQTLNVGSGPNSGTGESLRSAMIKVNSNFTYAMSVIAEKPDSVLLRTYIDTQLNLKASLVYVDAAVTGLQASDADLTAIAAIAPTNDDVIQRKAGAWTNRSVSQYKIDLALQNVDNTTDLAKPVSTLTQTALDGKQTLDADLTTIAGLAPANDDFLQRKSAAWAFRTVAQVKTDLAINNVDNTSDASKPVSTLTQTALDGKQTLDADLTSVAGLSPSNDDIVQRKSGAWTNRTVAQYKTDLALNLVENIPSTAADVTGTAIAFAVPQTYGTFASPETGNVTINTTGLIKGMCQLLIHNNGSTPSFAGTCKIVSGTYATGEVNYIMLMAVSTTLILVTISQEL